MSRKRLLLLIWLYLLIPAKAYVYDPNDFAAEVIFYNAGAAADMDWINGLPFDDPNNALGRPTIDTTGENWNIPLATQVPVVSVYSAFRSFELVTVGNGGELILKFNHPVSDDENNLYGIDFIIFGNAQQKASQFWKNGDPNLFIISTSQVIEEAAIISVSQDGVNWYCYTNGPYADTFPPTFGRVYDTAHPDANIGSWNKWWGHPTDPTIPLDPTITSTVTTGKTVAQMSIMYGLSAGGIGFDIAESGMDWILYVKIEGNDVVTPEVDAVADVACCGDYKHPSPLGDIDFNCTVDYGDIAAFACCWLVPITDPNDPAKQADLNNDNAVNFKDWSLLSGTWSQCTWQCK